MEKLEPYRDLLCDPDILALYARYTAVIQVLAARGDRAKAETYYNAMCALWQSGKLAAGAGQIFSTD